MNRIRYSRPEIDKFLHDGVNILAVSFWQNSANIVIFLTVVSRKVFIIKSWSNAPIISLENSTYYVYKYSFVYFVNSTLEFLEIY